MKKLFVITLITGTIFACSRKTTPPSEIIISNQEKHVENKEPEITATKTNASMPGQNVYTMRCGRCHELKPVENWTGQQWGNILKIMTVKAGLNETETKQVTAYVMEHAKK